MGFYYFFFLLCVLSSSFFHHHLFSTSMSEIKQTCTDYVSFRSVPFVLSFKENVKPLESQNKKLMLTLT